MEKIFIIIPNWNGIDFIEECLDSLVLQSKKASIIVVDNGSVDGSDEIVRKKYPDIKLIKNEHNLGFGGGVNVGIRYALKKNAEYVILFNNDAVADKNWTKGLVETAAANPKVGIVTCKFMRMNDSILDSTGELYSIWGLPFPRGRNEKDNKKYDSQRVIFGGTGGASLYRATMLNQIGIFDEDFFAYFEDVDISFRAQLAGWRVLYEPNAVAYHHVSGTSSKLGDFARFHSAKNFLLLYAKNMPTKLYLKYLPLFTLQLMRMLITSVLRGKLLVFLKGTFAAIRLHPSTVQKRKQIQSSRVVSLDYIDNLLYTKRPPKPPAKKGLSHE